MRGLPSSPRTVVRRLSLLRTCPYSATIAATSSVRCSPTRPSFNIVIETKFEIQFFYRFFSPWNGVFVKEPKQDLKMVTTRSTSAYELNWLAMQTPPGNQPGTTRAGGTPNNFTGKTIKLGGAGDCRLAIPTSSLSATTPSGHPSNSFAVFSMVKTKPSATSERPKPPSRFYVQASTTISF